MTAELLTLADHALITLGVLGLAATAFRFPWGSLPGVRASSLERRIAEAEHKLSDAERTQAGYNQELERQVLGLTGKLEDFEVRHRAALQELKDEKSRWIQAGAARAR